LVLRNHEGSARLGLTLGDTARHGSRRVAELPSYLYEDPPESPDLNPIDPIENLWHELKEFIRREVKPHTKDELVRGIREFWETVTVEKCARYIRHLRKVFPKVITEQGGPTGY
jgi:hypothetical protein